ncbi:ABC transporter permease [Taibaiella koreensis]|uniref:ABC transporter permease n=1 Tax=Taibaiella koreensis TaxID=1268548 RepID=UPI000E59A6AA|nr:ABC transporter permease [Taibaiella koreensis]
MITTFLNSFSSEWLKRKRTAGAWLTIAGGFFIPLIILIQRFYFSERLAGDNASSKIWEMLYSRCWQGMAFFLLPMGVILVTTLVGQVEYRNQTWKQLHATPQSPTTIFFAKLAVILVMLLQFFILFNVGIYLTGVLPALFIKRVPFPAEAFPWGKFMLGNSKFLLTCLPVLALQFLLSLQFRNFMVPIGVGLGLYILSMMVMQWQYAYIVPYIYSAAAFMKTGSNTNIYAWAFGYFALFGTGSYLLFLFKKERS